MNRTVIFLIVGFWFSFFAVESHAESMMVPSVEWLTCSADVIVVGKVDQITTKFRAEGKFKYLYDYCSVKAEEVLKGELPSDRLHFVTFSGMRSRMQSSEGCIFFLSPTDDFVDGQCVFKPTTRSFPFSIFDLSEEPIYAFNVEMEAIRDVQGILGTARKWAKTDVDLYLDLYDHDGELPEYIMWVRVPVEEEYRAQYEKMARSDNPSERADGAKELWKFPGGDTDEILKSLLEDTSERLSCYSYDISKSHFFVREAAYRSLKRMGKNVPEIQLERAATEVEKRNFRHKYWRKAISGRMRDGWKVINIKDGVSGPLTKGNDTAVVIVTCRLTEGEFNLTLVPHVWGEPDEKYGAYLGCQNRYCIGARRFYSSGDMPDVIRNRIVDFFDLSQDGEQ